MVASSCARLVLELQVKVWDIRTFKPVHQYFTATPATSMALSQKGLLAVGYGPHVQVRTSLSLSLSFGMITLLLFGRVTLARPKGRAVRKSGELDTG